MTRELFLEKLRDILDTDREFDWDTPLSELEDWDSLSVVSFRAMINVECGQKLDVKAIGAARTVGDLFELIQ